MCALFRILKNLPYHAFHPVLQGLDHIFDVAMISQVGQSAGAHRRLGRPLFLVEAEGCDVKRRRRPGGGGVGGQHHRSRERRLYFAIDRTYEASTTTCLTTSLHRKVT